MLARQLLVGFLAVIVPSTILLGVVTLYSVVALDRVTGEFVEIIRSDEALSELHVTVNQAWAPLSDFLSSGDPATRRRFEEILRAARTRVESCGASRCHSSNQTPAQMAATLRPAIEELGRHGRLAFDGDDGDRALHIDAMREAMARVRALTGLMLRAIHLRGDELARGAEVVRRRAWILTVALGTAVVLAGALAALLIARRIARPLHGLLLGIRRVMGGDWTARVPREQRGEIGELASAFNTMVHEVREHRATLEEHNRTLEARVRQRTEELRQKEQALVQSEKLASLGLLAAGVAHELTNPLTSIVMNTNLMLEEVDEGSAFGKELRQIDADAGRCRRIIEDLRAFARVRQLERVPGHVETVVDEALAAAARDLAQGGVEVRRELAPDLPRISWDPARMVQVLINLLVNAAHAADGKGRVVVRARREGAWLRLEVEDDGVGIPAADRTRIFDPFFTTKPDGTGLGLSISHGIVNEHGGRIEVESATREDAAPGGRTGTTMRIFVPVGEAVA